MTANQGAERTSASLDLRALSLEDLARVLSAAGGQQISVEMLEEDLAAGAPQNADGTVNLLHYAAWLARAAS